MTFRICTEPASECLGDKYELVALEVLPFDAIGTRLGQVQALEAKKSMLKVLETCRTTDKRVALLAVNLLGDPPSTLMVIPIDDADLELLSDAPWQAAATEGYAAAVKQNDFVRVGCWSSAEVWPLTVEAADR